jgi:hypothetical protein
MVANPNNPLFARVMVNRIWQHHFGTGLVATPSDFGGRGAAPTHPELLDWLAVEFAENGFSLKHMHRLIMRSETYRRNAMGTGTVSGKDPSNALLSHFHRRQLSAEELRDSILQASGILNLKMGGMPVVPPLEKDELYGMIGQPDVLWPVTPHASEHSRRSIYLIRRRTFQQPLLAAFDQPDGVLSCSRRNESVTAPQALAMLNSQFVIATLQLRHPA